MKKRIKIDGAILSFAILLTGLLYLNAHLYRRSVLFDNILDFVGMMTILEGILWRMWARGHKKAHSKKSESLVTTGPYTLVRNPMYLGSFLIGAGFVLLVWPWWGLFVFALLFYLRFKQQIEREETLLTEAFGSGYQTYCSEVPRIFPALGSLKHLRIKEIFNLNETFSSKEKRGLWIWPLAAFVFETVQEDLIFGYTDLKRTLIVFASAIITYTLAVGIMYKNG